MGLPPDISGISGTVTGPSHSPARVFMAAKDFCASDGAAVAEVFCPSCWAKAKVVSDKTTRVNAKRKRFMLDPPTQAHLSFSPHQLFSNVDQSRQDEFRYCFS